MNARPTKPWRCLRGHDNEPEVRRCEACSLPRWVTWYSIGVAGIALLIGLGAGGYFLSQFLKQRQYTSLVRKVWGDDQKIAADERKALDDLRDYLRVSAAQAAQWERAVTGETAKALAGQEAGSPVSAATVTEDLRRIRADLEQGRLRQARQTVETLRREQPQREDIQRLQEEIEKTVRGRIEVKVLGETGGHHILDAQAALIALKGGERSFRFYVEPHEEMYFYLYRVDGSGKIEVLFPTTDGNHTNPLRAGQEYWLPSPDPENGYRFQTASREIKEIYLVSSRWSARELEQWAAELTGERGEEAGKNILQALQERQEAKVGGCDVRMLQFARASRG